MNTETAIVKQEPQQLSTGVMDGPSFDHIQRVAKCFSSSALIPTTFQNNIPNTVIAMEMANRIGASPLAVMQNLYVIHGRPSWSSQFVIACLNTCGRFEPLMFEATGTGDAKQCVAWTTTRGVKLQPRDDRKQWTVALAKEAGIVVFDGPPVSIAMAKAEGWYQKNGSKWQTIPDLMLRYRSASFFCSLYAPELKMGLRCDDEIIDIESATPVRQATPESRFQKKITAPSEPSDLSEPEGASAPAADSVQEPVSEPEPATPEPVVEQPKPADTIAAKAEAYYKKEGQTLAQVVAALAKLKPKVAETITATTWAELTVPQVECIYATRYGVSRAIKDEKK